MNYIARLITEWLQFLSLLGTLLAGFATYRAFDDMRTRMQAGQAAPDTIFGVHAVIFLGSVTLISLAFFLLSSTCWAILETARNTAKLVDKRGS